MCTGSYYGRERIFDLLVVTDRDSYRLDVFRDVLTTGAGPAAAGGEEETCALLSTAFADAAGSGADVAISGAAVLPAMRVLETVQAAWDDVYGPRSLPGRPLAAHGGAAGLAGGRP